MINGLNRKFQNLDFILVCVCPFSKTYFLSYFKVFGL